MVTSLFTCSGASVGVSISTQRRMPSRMVLESKGLAVVSMWLFISSGKDRWTGVNVTLARFRARRKPLSVSSALVRSFARGDLFDHLDNASPELGVGDARERAS